MTTLEEDRDYIVNCVMIAIEHVDTSKLSEWALERLVEWSVDIFVNEYCVNHQ